MIWRAVNLYFGSCRRMFPTIRCSFSGFQDFLFGQKFGIVLDVVPCDNKRYRYAYHRSSWLVAGKADPPPPKRQYLHPDSPFTNKQLERKRLTVSFEKVKLTNNESDKTGQVTFVWPDWLPERSRQYTNSPPNAADNLELDAQVSTKNSSRDSEWSMECEPWHWLDSHAA